MKKTVFSYTTQYAIVGFVFLMCLICERELGLFSLTIWLLSYLVYRRTSVSFLFVLTMILDLCFFHVLGSSLIYISILMVLFEFMRGMNIPKKIQWFCVALCITAYNSLLTASIYLPIGFFLSSLLFFLPFVYRIRIRDLFFHQYA